MTGSCSLKVLKIRLEITEMSRDASDCICMKLKTVSGPKWGIKTNLKNADRSACPESEGIRGQNRDGNAQI